MAPEYALQGLFSVKLDVFSFGVLVLEIISGKKNSSFLQSHGHELRSYAWNLWRDGQPLALLDSSINGASCDKEEVIKSIHMGLQCVQEDAKHRPTMASVVLMLNSSSYTLPNLNPPGPLEKFQVNQPDSHPDDETSRNESVVTKLYTR
ncbi:OLC1v1021886C1 [Oldenlandia corymbosa var. corymbosa]|uniref:OLC1v1021886C1 n=1 Tax=Oldenlandia corymbosa var. corymbosa TaxID=529605 RepID=A0AAV1BY05_OLDCO|nr:OLC1v1021886C1 [Oldenlandia corymbosa var. corymbosa]